MTDTVYYIICAVLTLGVLVGIALMSKVKTAVQGLSLIHISSLWRAAPLGNCKSACDQSEGASAG